MLGVQLLATLQKNLVGLQSLHGINKYLALAIGTRKEVEVADAEPRLLPNRGCGFVLVRHNAVVLPRVVRDEIVHVLHTVQAHGSRRWEEGLVDEPGNHTGHGDVLPPANEEGLGGPVLEACTDVLDSESSESKHRGGLAGDKRVVELAEHAVADLPIEHVLALVLEAFRLAQTPRIHGHSGEAHLHFVFTASHFHRGVILLLLRVVWATLLLVDDHLAFGDVRVHLIMSRDPELVAGGLKVIQQLSPRWPRAHILRDLVVRVVLKVIDAFLRLQLRRGVRVGDPGRPSENIVPVVSNEVFDALLQEAQCLP
mmetsp:Transcript_46817/g.100112  ORF Transcript_46817/g.100112 Transcript_46817/m.100112 type:complete len:312 (+) Transcript_46817:660-1595(+)